MSAIHAPALIGLADAQLTQAVRMTEAYSKPQPSHTMRCTRSSSRSDEYNELEYQYSLGLLFPPC
jgi:hypothetical protein